MTRMTSNGRDRAHKIGSEGHDMRFRQSSPTRDLVAVSEANTVSFAMLVTDAVKDGLLAFAVD